MSKPNTFIVGAPKCGTTALSSYLAEHPNVFMCSPKEPHHFIHDEMPQKTDFHSLESYLELFSKASEQHHVVAEASVWYLYSSSALKNIFRFNPNSKIIVMLRRPDEMVYSMHSQALVTLQENIKDFTQAWRQSTTHEKRLSYSKHCREPKLLEYDKIALYGEQLLRGRNYFPDAQIHIVLFEDFKSNPKLTYQKVLNFLDIPYDNRTNFPQINPNTQLRNKIIGSALRKPPSPLMTAGAFIKKLLGIKKLKIRNKLMALNQVSKSRPKIDDDLRMEIINNYDSDIKLLESITGRDLSSWRK